MEAELLWPCFPFRTKSLEWLIQADKLRVHPLTKESPMRRTVTPLMLFVALCLVTQPLTAQVDLTDDRTAEQKWTRSVYLIDFAYVGFIAYAKSVGQTPEQLGTWMTEFAGPSWGAPGSRTIASFVRGLFRNYNLYDNFEFEILSESESEIRCRMNSPYANRFGDSGEVNGVTIQEFQQLMPLFYEGVADHLGFDMTHEINGEWIEFTVRTRS